MKKFYLTALALCCGLAAAQSTPSKKELVAKILVLQQNAIEQTAQSLAERPALQMLQQANMALQTRVSPDKREAIAKEIQADAKKYSEEVSPLVRQNAVRLAPSTVGVMLDQRFTEDELKQLLAIMESPVNRKYLQMGGELQKALGDKLVIETQSMIEPKVKALESAIVKHLDAAIGPRPKASEPAAKASKK